MHSFGRENFHAHAFKWLPEINIFRLVIITIKYSFHVEYQRRSLKICSKCFAQESNFVLRKNKLNWMRTKQMKDLNFKMKTWISNFLTFISRFCLQATRNLKLLDGWNYLFAATCSSHRMHTLLWDLRSEGIGEDAHVFNRIDSKAAMIRSHSSLQRQETIFKDSKIRMQSQLKNAKMVYRLPISVLSNIRRAHIRKFFKIETNTKHPSMHFFCWNFISKVLSIFCHSSLKSTMVFNEDPLISYLSTLFPFVFFFQVVFIIILWK